MKATIILSAACLFLMVASSVDAQNYPPQNLYVDPLSLLAIWDPPGTTRPGMSSRELIDYYVFLDDSLVGATADTQFPLDSMNLSYGSGHIAGVAAHYSSGISDTIWYVFTSLYVQPLDSISADCDNGTVTLSWSNPDTLSEYVLGYNIYRDGDFVNYVPYQPTPTYIEEVGVGIFCYTVTIVYDLTPWGYPGEEGESMEQGPACPTCDFGFDLPFNENWNLGNFNENLWTTNGENWSINGQIGNPAPSAEFSWDPWSYDYEYGLESYPFRGDTLVTGNIYLDFDIKLNDVNSTGTEHMLIQVWNWSEQLWHTLDTFSNTGSFNWTHVSIDLTPYAIQQIFKVRFLGKGENSVNILSWFLDNINIYRKCTAPENLTTRIDELNYPAFILEWDPVAGYSPADGTSSFWHYQVYRRVDNNDYEILGTPTTEYFRDDDVTWGYVYCYVIDAVFTISYDTCISGHSNEACDLLEHVPNDPDNANINLYPNPVNSIFVVKSSYNIQEIGLYSITGRLIRLEMPFENEVSWVVSYLPSGIYMLRVIIHDQPITRKVVVMH